MQAYLRATKRQTKKYEHLYNAQIQATLLFHLVYRKYNDLYSAVAEVGPVSLEEARPRLDTSESGMETPSFCIRRKKEGGYMNESIAAAKCCSK